MKKLKYILTLVICAAMSQNITAQETGTSLGLRAGVNFQNINGKNPDGSKTENKLITGFNAGVNAEIPLDSEFFVQPGLLFSTKGAKSKFTVMNQSYTSTLKLSYIELPINFVYKPMLGSGRLILGFGPYVALGVAGTFDSDIPGESAEMKVKFQNTVKASDSDDRAYVKPLDAGANMMFGYELSNKLSVQLNTQLGLLKINPDYEGSSDDKSSAKNTGFGISVGYRF